MVRGIFLRSDMVVLMEDRVLFHLGHHLFDLLEGAHVFSKLDGTLKLSVYFMMVTNISQSNYSSPNKTQIRC